MVINAAHLRICSKKSECGSQRGDDNTGEVDAGAEIRDLGNAESGGEEGENSSYVGEPFDFTDEDQGNYDARVIFGESICLQDLASEEREGLQTKEFLSCSELEMEIVSLEALARGA